LIVSQYSQQLREGYIRSSFLEFFELSLLHAEYCRFKEIINRQKFLSDSNSIRSIYEINWIKKNVLLDFLHELRLPAIDSYTDPGSYFLNKSLSLQQMSVFKYLLQNDYLFNLKPHLKILILESFLNKFDWSIFGEDKYIECSRKMLKSCRDVFYDENLWIKNNFELIDFDGFYQKSIDLFGDLSIVDFEIDDKYLNLINNIFSIVMEKVDV
jgi:hypothetical protein